MIVWNGMDLVVMFVLGGLFVAGLLLYVGAHALDWLKNKFGW